MDRVDVYESASKGFDTEYQIAARLPSLSRSSIHRYIKCFERVGLIDMDRHLTPLGTDVLALLSRFRESPGGRILGVDIDSSHRRQVVDVALEAKLLERRPFWEKCKMMVYYQLDPELAVVFPALRQVAENFPLLDAFANGRLLHELISGTAQRINSRAGPLSRFVG